MKSLKTGQMSRTSYITGKMSTMRAIARRVAPEVVEAGAIKMLLDEDGTLILVRLSRSKDITSMPDNEFNRHWDHRWRTGKKALLAIKARFGGYLDKPYFADEWMYRKGTLVLEVPCR